MANAQRSYYTNPAFCQQSEFYNSQHKIKSPSPQKKPAPRQSPIGANTYHQQYSENPKRDYEEQEFYEEVLVDGSGQVTTKNLVVVSSPNKEQKYYAANRNTHRYEEIPGDRYGYDFVEDKNEVYVDEYPLPNKKMSPGGAKGRYEYIPLTAQEEVAAKQMRDTGAIREGYALIRKNDRYELLPLEKVSDTYRYNQTPTKSNRYDYIQETSAQSSRYEVIKSLSPQPQRRPVNPAATHKLYELLSTPKKTIRPSPTTPQTPSSPSRRDSFATPPKNQKPTPRAQQKLNYALGTRQMTPDKRSTAIISPICSSPVHSVYSEGASSNRTEYWMNTSGSKAPVQATLAVAAIMMILCGGVTCGLCFYMISVMGRLYYLDFGVLSGFICLLLGLLGFRSRNCYWLPNRNFISGYIILSVFSLLTCAGLLVLLFTQPKPGSPLADMTSGAVCGISVLSLALASGGVLASYCCKYPPPDNRVQHCARGFTV